MTDCIFYSWQSDITAACCRTFIGDALKRAVRGLPTDGAEVFSVDRDTEGVPGSPDIAATIFAKIERAAVFVADVTIIGSTPRPTPNPNVLIELGYAFRALGERRIILVQNAAFGGPELLPFDLRQKRVMTYSSGVGQSERAPERKRLTEKLHHAIATIVAEPRPVSDQHTRWRKLLEKARAERIWVELNSPLLFGMYATTARGLARAPAELAGPILVAKVENHLFELGIPVRGRGGITIAPVPFSQVEDIWPGAEGRLHVMLKRALVLENGTSRLVDDHP